MRVSYKWLQDYVDVPWTVDELAEKLTMVGLMVERMEKLAEGIDDIVVAQVTAVEPHPEAEQLVVATVTDGAEQYVVVTGASNVAEGLKVPLAKPGVTLPGGQRIETATLRGVRSEGMLCSEAELGVGDDADGLWELPDDVTVGRPIAEQLGLDDTVLHLEVYPNRPDCLSVIGVAREIAAMTGQRVRLPEAELRESERAAEDTVRVRIDDADLCPRYSARIVERVSVGPSPAWLQQRLRVAGMRPINNIVDVTNFVMWEWGQPLHAFDFDRITGDEIIVRRATDGEVVVTLDGQQRKLTKDALVIADGEDAVAVAGVMGAANSEVSEHTTTLLLESAAFHPTSVRRTAQRFGLRTEASHRFEKGLDPNLVALASARAAHLMQRVAGGDVLRGSTDVYPRPVSPWTVPCRPERVRSLLGVEIDDDAMVRHLEALELTVQRRDGALAVTIPTFRPDLRQEVDLIEEIARLYGYDNVPARLPGGVFDVAHQAAPLPMLDRVRKSLVGAGLLETMTYSFVDGNSGDKLGWASDDSRRRMIELRNPLKDDLAVMRTSLLAGLLETAAYNRTRRNTSVHVFEIGAVFLAEQLPLTDLPREARRIGLLMTGILPERHWGRKPTPVTFYHVKGVVERLCADLGVAPTFAPSDESALHPGRRAVVCIDGRPLGVLGEVHPDVATKYNLDDVRLYVAELDGDVLAEAAAEQRTMYERLPRYPAVERDMALVVPQTVSAADIEAVLWAAGGELLQDVRLFDVYEGEQVDAGHKSLAYSLTLRAADRTLTDEDATRAIQRIDDALAERFGVRRRT